MAFLPRGASKTRETDSSLTPVSMIDRLLALFRGVARGIVCTIVDQDGSNSIGCWTQKAEPRKLSRLHDTRPRPDHAAHLTVYGILRRDLSCNPTMSEVIAKRYIARSGVRVGDILQLHQLSGGGSWSPGPGFSILIQRVKQANC